MEYALAPWHQRRIDFALQSIIPALRQSLAAAGLDSNLHWNFDENAVYIGAQEQVRIFWHDPSSQYVCERETLEGWQLRAKGTDSFVHDVIESLEADLPATTRLVYLTA